MELYNCRVEMPVDDTCALHNQRVSDPKLPSYSTGNDGSSDIQLSLNSSLSAHLEHIFGVQAPIELAIYSDPPLKGQISVPVGSRTHHCERRLELGSLHLLNLSRVRARQPVDQTRQIFLGVVVDDNPTLLSTRIGLDVDPSSKRGRQQCRGMPILSR